MLRAQIKKQGWFKHGTLQGTKGGRLIFSLAA